MKRRAVLSVFAAAALIAPTLAACGSSGSSGPSSSATCPGNPIKLMTITPLTSPVQHEPEIPAGAKAAAAAVTRTCELGRPVEIIVCDDKYDPNTAASCGREAVSEGVLAVVGSTSAFSANYLPILEKAGIPSVGDLASSAEQNSSKYVFPLQNPLTIITGMATAAKSLGADKVAIVGINVSAVSYILDVVKATIEAEGMDYADPVLVPPKATNLNQYAAQAVSTGADAIIPILPAPFTSQLITALDQQGVDFDKTRMIVGGTVLTPQLVNKLGDTADGLYEMGVVWPTTDASNEGIAQYKKELKASGQDNVSQNDNSVIAWASVHIIADLLEGATDITPATLMAKLKSSGRITRPELAPFNFGDNPFPKSSPLSKLRAFSDMAIVTRVEDGKLVPVVDGFVDYTKPFSIGG